MTLEKADGSSIGVDIPLPESVTEVSIPNLNIQTNAEYHSKSQGSISSLINISNGYIISNTLPIKSSTTYYDINSIGTKADVYYGKLTKNMNITGENIDKMPDGNYTIWYSGLSNSRRYTTSVYATKSGSNIIIPTGTFIIVAGPTINPSVDFTILAILYNE